MRIRKIWPIAGMVLTLCILPACNIVEECGSCEEVTEAPDGTKTYGTPLLVCGDELKEKENASPVTRPNGDVVYWNCY
jgi:hypothetical protein